MIRAIGFSLMMAVVVAVSSFMPEVQASENKTVILDVPGMTCQFCPITIRKALEKVPGVIKAEADFESKTATVTFHPDKTSVEALTNATANAGYPSILKP